MGRAGGTVGASYNRRELGEVSGERTQVNTDGPCRRDGRVKGLTANWGEVLQIDRAQWAQFMSRSGSPGSRTYPSFRGCRRRNPESRIPGQRFNRPGSRLEGRDEGEANCATWPVFLSHPCLSVFICVIPPLQPHRLHSVRSQPRHPHPHGPFVFFVFFRVT